MNVLTPREIDLPMRGSIQQIQMNVTQTLAQTRLGHGKQPTTNPILNVDSCGLQLEKRHCASLLKQKQQRGRSRV